MTEGRRMGILYKPVPAPPYWPPAGCKQGQAPEENGCSEDAPCGSEACPRCGRGVGCGQVKNLIKSK